MDTGKLIVVSIGLVFYVLGTVQWFEPKHHRLSKQIANSDAPTAGEKAQKGMNSVVRAMAVAGLYVAGFFLMVGWGTVFNRMYQIFDYLLSLGGL